MSPALLLLLPLLSVVVIFLFTSWSGRLSSWVSVASVAATLGVTLSLFTADTPGVSMSWIALGDLLSVDIGLRWDRLSRGMMFVVTLIGTLVHVFSLAYMRDDAARARYFGSLF